MTYYNPSKEQQLPIQSMPPPPWPQCQDQPPTVYYAHTAITDNNFVPHFDRKTSTRLGAAQIIFACLSIAAGAMAIVCEAGCYYVGVGIWAGVWYLVAGSLALAAGMKPTNSLITATWVSFFNLIFGAAQVTTASFGLMVELNCYEGHPPYYQDSTCVDWWSAAVAVNSVMIAVGSLEKIFGLWMRMISGHAIREGSKPPIANISVTFASNQPEPVFMQGLPPHPPALQSEPPPYYAQPQHPPYYVQHQYPSTSNQHQLIHIGFEQEAPSPNMKS